MLSFREIVQFSLIQIFNGAGGNNFFKPAPENLPAPSYQLPQPIMINYSGFEKKKKKSRESIIALL